jgi:hypothetical protein
MVRPLPLLKQMGDEGQSSSEVDKAIKLSRNWFGNLAKVKQYEEFLLVTVTAECRKLNGIFYYKVDCSRV